MSRSSRTLIASTPKLHEKRKQLTIKQCLMKQGTSYFKRIWKTRNQKIWRRIHIFIFYPKDLIQRIRQREHKKTHERDQLLNVISNETMNKYIKGYVKKFTSYLGLEQVHKGLCEEVHILFGA